MINQSKDNIIQTTIFKILCFSLLVLMAGDTQAMNQAQNHDAEPQDDCWETYYVDIHRSGLVDIVGDDGPKIARVGEFIIPSDDISYDPNESGVALVLPLHKVFTITWTVPEPGYLYLEITKGCGSDHLNYAVRYMDGPLTIGTKMMLKFDKTGPQDLRFDKNNNGKYEGIIKPAFVTHGKAALDLDGPEINFAVTKIDDSKTQIKISASDLSGIHDLFYRFEGDEQFKPYTGVITLDPRHVKLIEAYSHDNVGNKSYRLTRTTDELTLRISNSLRTGESLLLDLEPLVLDGEPYDSKVTYSYDWDFGDGSPHDKAFRATHRYKEAGSYTVTLIVTDNRGHGAQHSEVRQVKSK